MTSKKAGEPPHTENLPNAQPRSQPPQFEEDSAPLERPAPPQLIGVVVQQRTDPARGASVQSQAYAGGAGRPARRQPEPHFTLFAEALLAGYGGALAIP